MADDNRGSGRRLGVSTGKDSKRMAPASGASGSGARTAVNGTGSGRQAAVGTASGRQAAVGTTSGTRQAAVGTTSSSRQAAAQTSVNRAAVTTRRGAGASVARKKAPLPKKEMLIAGGILLVIITLCIVIGVWKGGTKNEVEAHSRAQQKIFDDNIQLGRDELAKAEKAGTLFAIGDEVVPPEDRVKLFAPFNNNSKIFNVIYDHGSVDKRKAEKHDVRKLYDDPDHSLIKTLNKSKDEGNLSISYGLVKDGTQPVVVAKKIVKGKKDDIVNIGGQILVIVGAQSDDFFVKAQTKEAEAPTEAPKTENKAATAPTSTAATTPTATK